VFQIRIRINFGGLDPNLDPHWKWECGSGSRSRRAKLTHKNRKREEISNLEMMDILL
jgi:hypothetical protein